MLVLALHKDYQLRLELGLNDATLVRHAEHQLRLWNHKSAMELVI